MKKIVLAALCLLFALALPCLCFANEQAAPEENIVEQVMNVIWYVILVVLFGGGLILISKWSKKINERDAEIEQQMQQAEEFEESEETVDGQPDEQFAPANEEDTQN